MNEALRNELLAMVAEDRASEAARGMREVGRVEGRMSGVKLNPLVLKTHQLDKLKEFYSALGLSFVEELL